MRDRLVLHTLFMRARWWSRLPWPRRRSIFVKRETCSVVAVSVVHLRAGGVRCRVIHPDGTECPATEGGRWP